jgi:drug/metabolite transporter (DMT)-like permease
MSVGEIIFMVLVVGVAIVMAVLKDKMPSWLGFILMLAAGIVTIIGSAVTKNYKAVPLGAASILATVIVWIGGATSSAATTEDPDTLGGVASKAAWWAWLTAAAMVVAAVGISFALP